MSYFGVDTPPVSIRGSLLKERQKDETGGWCLYLTGFTRRTEMKQTERVRIKISVTTKKGMYEVPFLG